MEFDPELVVPDWSLSLADGAVAPWKGDTPAAQRKHRKPVCEPFLAKAGIRWNTPLEKLTPKRREQLLHGDGKQFAGVLAMLEKEYDATTSESKRQRLETFRGEVTCAECGGARLRPEARSVRVGGKAIHEITAMTVAAAPRPRSSTRAGASTEERSAADRPADPRRDCRPAGLPDRVGLDYLTLDRPAGTLSGGELQRVRLATGLGSGLVGVCYVLDEPSIGLHPRDNQRLIDALRDLQARGNTVLVVEHDETIMRRADWLVDLGPGRGPARRPRRGPGHARRRSPPARTRSPAATWPAVERIPVARAAAAARPRPASITIEGVTTNNLKDVTVQFPLSALVCVTGVSGSGKSSLLNETLARALVRRLGGIGAQARPAHAASAAPARSTRWSRSTSRPSAARRGAIRPPTPACSTRSARCSPTPATPGSGATRRAASASTSRAAAARSARARGSRRSR